MSGLDISTGFLIDTTVLHEHALSIERVRESLLDTRWVLAQLAGGIWWTGLDPVAEPGLRAQLEDVGRTLDAVPDELHRIIDGLHLAASGYELLETTLAGRGELLAGLVGTALPPALLMMLPLAAPLSIATLLALVNDPQSLRDGAADPRVVRLLRLLASGADEAIMTGAGLPAPLALALGDAGLGVLSTEKAAAALSRATGDASIATELRSGRPASVSPPTGVGELVGRIPTGDEQIRIERYPSADGDRWIVLIDGTRSGSLGTDPEPWDMSSNLQGIAGVPSASTEAVLAAMSRAGIGAQDPVLLVGYSQGGLIAARVAEQRGTAAGLVTVGSPIAGLPLPRDIPVLAIEHSEDPVPALGGVVGAGTAASLSTVTVRRTLYADAPPSDDRLVPAHQFARYRETANLVDGSDDSRLAPIRAVLAEFAADGTAQEYRAERVEDSPSREPAAGKGRGSR